MAPRTDTDRVGFLGPPGTFSEQALIAALADPGAVTPVAQPTIHRAVMAVQDGEVRWSLVPIENSIEGPVTVTLDTLAGEATDVRIAGEIVLSVRQCLIARDGLGLDAIDTVLSHPQATGQCERFLRERLPGARIEVALSTADAVRALAEPGRERAAAIGPALAAERYGMHVLAEGIEDHEDNETRFVWCARAGDAPPPTTDRRGGGGAHKTSLVFWGAGAQQPGWLVDCLGEFARRGVNLTKIESRPRRDRLGRYMFFVDADGGAAAQDAIEALRSHCEEVRVLGSYPAWG